MGDVIQMTGTVDGALEAAKEVAKELNADGVIVLIIHGGYVSPLADKPYMFSTFAGYLETAKATAMFESVEE